MGLLPRPHIEGEAHLVLRFRMLLAALCATAVITAAAPTAADAGQRRQMVRAINFVRSWGHHRSLGFSARLSRGAASWARHLMRTDVLAHSATALRRQEGEVIEWHTGAAANVNKVVLEWLNSPGHRGVMLSHRYRRAGAGKAVGWMRGRKSTIWVVRFAR
jgi:uncharacterized protein YkwD